MVFYSLHHWFIIKVCRYLWFSFTFSPFLKTKTGKQTVTDTRKGKGNDHRHNANGTGMFVLHAKDDTQDTNHKTQTTRHKTQSIP